MIRNPNISYAQISEYWRSPDDVLDAPDSRRRSVAHNYPMCPRRWERNDYAQHRPIVDRLLEKKVAHTWRRNRNTRGQPSAPIGGQTVR